MDDHLILNQQSSTDDLQLLTIKGYFILKGVMSLKYIWEMKPLLPVVMMLSVFTGLHALRRANHDLLHQ